MGRKNLIIKIFAFVLIQALLLTSVDACLSAVCTDNFSQKILQQQVIFNSLTISTLRIIDKFKFHSNLALGARNEVISKIDLPNVSIYLNIQLGEQYLNVFSVLESTGPPRIHAKYILFKLDRIAKSFSSSVFLL